MGVAIDRGGDKFFDTIIEEKDMDSDFVTARRNSKVTAGSGVELLLGYDLPIKDSRFFLKTDIGWKVDDSFSRIAIGVAPSYRHTEKTSLSCGLVGHLGPKIDFSRYKNLEQDEKISIYAQSAIGARVAIDHRLVPNVSVGLNYTKMNYDFSDIPANPMVRPGVYSGDSFGATLSMWFR